MTAHLRAQAAVGVPYSDEMIAEAVRDARAQADPNADPVGLEARYAEGFNSRVQQRDFDGQPQRLTEMDALVAYLQMLGTLVDLTTFEPVEGGR